jgi:hypothetical protein
MSRDFLELDRQLLATGEESLAARKIQTVPKNQKARPE